MTTRQAKAHPVTVQHVVQQLNLGVTNDAGLEREITGGYASDLLSCVMAGAREGNIWVTLQAHPNVIAVASLVGLSAVVITEGIQPDQETIHRAANEQITLLTTTQTTFNLVGKLAELGI
jgi:serine kinase of HPr protein (carbohydrate metabolism regulator)